MKENALVFHSGNASMSDIIEHVINNPPHLTAADVEIVDAACAAQGEVWSPQLPAYEAWVARDAEVGTDGDLRIVGALGMGISDQERERLLQKAASQDVASASASAPAHASQRVNVDVRGVIHLRQDVDGYALVGFDLRRSVEALGSRAADDIVVALPAYVDGVPIVRIAPEACARRLVQGVGVHVLVVPDTVLRIGARAFSALSAAHIHLGRNVQELGEQPCDMASVSPRLTQRCYSVHDDNHHFVSCEGSLYTAGKTRALFLAAPYAPHVRLAPTITHIESCACAQGCEPPTVVSCSDALSQVRSKTWDDAVWLCPHHAPAYHPLSRRGVRVASPRAWSHEGCWYDADDAGAVLVAGSSASSSACAIPPVVAERPLVRIGVRALPTAPASVVIPDTVQVIERDNACRGTKRLVLSQNLAVIGAHCFCSRMLEGPVALPASLRAIGEGCFEYAVCKLEHTGSIVHISADQLLSCFLDDPSDGIPFDFARYDQLLLANKSLPDRIGALLHRLVDPVACDGEVRRALVARLQACETEALQRVVREGDRAMVEALVHAGFIGERNFERQIELLRAGNRTDCVAYLMQWHREQGGGCTPSASLRDRFAL